VPIGLTAIGKLGSHAGLIAQKVLFNGRSTVSNEWIIRYSGFNVTNNPDRDIIAQTGKLVIDPVRKGLIIGSS